MQKTSFGMQYIGKKIEKKNHVEIIFNFVKGGGGVEL